MMKYFSALVLAVLLSSSAYAQNVYPLTPFGSGQLEDVLGGNAALKASEFYDFMKSKWKILTVEPIYKNGVIDNVEDLIPYEVIVMPELVTIHTSQMSGSQFDYNRQNHSAASPRPVTVNPAEDSVFVYALNKDGKLIYPLARNANGDGMDYASIYSIQAFQEHSNFTSFSQPIITNTDIDIVGVYMKDKPNMNPPNVLMFRGRTVGLYALTLAVRFNEQFISVSTPANVKALANNKIISKTVKVNVVDGPETIDQLLLNVSRSLGLQDESRNFEFEIKEGDALEVSLSGRKIRKIWKLDSLQYQNNGSLTVMLKQANWTYSNWNQKSDAPYDADLIFVQKLTADGTSVRIVANKLPSTVKEGKGIVTVEAHGRLFNINVRVVK